MTKENYDFDAKAIEYLQAFQRPKLYFTTTRHTYSKTKNI